MRKVLASTGKTYALRDELATEFERSLTCTAREAGLESTRGSVLKMGLELIFPSKVILSPVAIQFRDNSENFEPKPVNN